MLLTVYSQLYGNDVYDYSGVDVFVGSGSFEEASKLVVGHHLSSKLVMLPSDGWKVKGICPATCTGQSGLADEENVTAFYFQKM